MPQKLFTNGIEDEQRLPCGKGIDSSDMGT